MADESKLRRLAAELRDADDDETTGDIIVQPGATVIVDQTGKHRALQPDEVTPTDRGKKSDPPKSGLSGAIATGGGVLVKVVSAVNNPYALGALALLVAAFVAWLKLRP